ncbi:bacterial Ig-like domain-containing protein [Lactiplantibacillus herbarum]|uniref:bacterial Ig-like domain-containing protein n=1 Tax=Lactiplantibacillus herbarum TaxID=1670446 RepID=UPI00069D2459|nr:bacterial Ig-like domain-containing protein [Lactiplantibacillus herbarum]
MKPSTNTKVRYKMYKKGKMWLIAGMATLTWQAMSLTGQADTDNAQAESTSQNTDTATTLQSKTVTLTSTSNTSTSSSEISTSNADAATSQSATVATTSAATQPSVATSSSTAKSEAADAVSSSQPQSTKSESATSTSQVTSVASADSTSQTAGSNAASVSSATTAASDNQASEATESSNDDSNKKQVSVTTTNATAIKTIVSTKGQLVKVAAVTTGYDDPSNIASGISNTSKWYISSDNTLHFEEGTLAEFNIIKVSGNGYDVFYTESAWPWYGYEDQVKTVIFDGPVVAGKNLAGFLGNLPNLESIKNLNLLDTLATENMIGLFYEDISLTSLDVSSLDTKNVTNMHSMFFQCASLTSLDLSGFDTSQVTDMVFMFTACSGLSSLNVSSFDTSKVTNMHDMFAGFVDLDTGLPTQQWSLDLSNFDTSQVTDMSGMFLLSMNLTDINISSFDTSKVTKIGGMFRSLGSLTSLDLSNFDMRQVTSLYNTVDESGFMTNLTGVKTLKLGINSRLIVGDIDSELPDVPTDGIYTGKWISTTTGKTYTSTELMALYADTAQTFTADTFIWQTTVMVQDTTLIAGPKTVWSTSDNYSSESVQSFNNVTVVVDGVVGGTVDTMTPGTYQVAYQYVLDGVTYTSEAATVTVIASQVNVTAENKTLTQNESWDAETAFTGALDADGSSLDFSKITVSGDVDTSTTGDYPVTYSYTDDYGNEKSVTITVSVVATTASVNAEDKTITQGSTWEAESAFVSGTDANGNAISFADVKVSGDKVDTSKPGTYKVTYTYTDKFGNEVAQMIIVTVTAADSKANVIAKDTTITQGSTWDPSAGFVSGTDADGNTISFDDVKVSGAVDTSKPGTYKVTYTYTDKYDNEVSQTIVVTVEAADSKASVTAKDMTVTQGSTWNAEDAFVSGTDADGNAISFDDVKVSGDTVDTSKPGTYKVTYTYTDKYDNEVSQTITVTVTAEGTDNNGGTDTDNNSGSDNNGGTDTAGNNGDSDNNGGTDTDNNGDSDNNGGTDTGDNGDGDNNGSTDTAGNNGDSDNNGGTDTGDNRDSDNNGSTDTNNNGETITGSNTSKSINANMNNKNSSTVNTDYQASTTKTVKLGAQTKGTAVDQLSKGNLPQTDEKTQSSAGIIGLTLLGFTGLLALIGTQRRRTNK